MAAVVARFGRPHFDLAAQYDNAKASDWYDPENDSLKQAWHQLPYLPSGLLWLNPPFSNIAPWAAKCAEESAKGARILFLVPASVGSNWYAQHVHGKALVLFLNGRLKFVGAKDPYPKDCLLAVYGEQPGFEVWKWK